MLPDLVSNPGPLTYESGALPIALRGPATNLSIFPDSLKGYCTVLQHALKSLEITDIVSS